MNIQISRQVDRWIDIERYSHFEVQIDNKRNQIETVDDNLIKIHRVRNSRYETELLRYNKNGFLIEN